MIDENYKLLKLKFTDFMKLNPEPWAGQRGLDDYRVDELVKQFKDNYEKYEYFLIRHPLYITEINDKVYLLDGQHRYNALKKIIDEYQINVDFYIPIGKIKCDNKKSAEREYLILNYNLPQRLIHIEKLERHIRKEQNDDFDSWDDDINDISIINDAFDQLKKIYVNFSDKKLRPYVHVESIKEEMKKHDIVNIYSISSSKELCNYIEELHKFYLGKSQSYFKNITLKCEGNKKEELKRVVNFHNDILKTQGTKSPYHLLGMLKTNNTNANGKSMSINYVNSWMNKLKKIIQESKQNFDFY